MSGPMIPGEDPENALLTACRAARNGNTNATTSSTDFSVPDTALAGTRATNAIGNDSRNARSEEALTSRATPPTATPKRAEGETAERQGQDPQGEARP